MKKKRNQDGVKALLIAVGVIVLVVGYYYYLSNRTPKTSKFETVTETAVQKVLSRNLDNNYPPTVREVLKYYGQISQCFYGETYTDEEFQQLALQIQRLYDEDLIANQTQEQYFNSLQMDIENMKKQEMVISSYSPASSTDVDYFPMDGYDWAKIRCTFTLRKSTQLATTEEIFLLRKDAQGHWKIYGWKLADKEGNQTDE